MQVTYVNFIDIFRKLSSKILQYRISLVKKLQKISHLIHTTNTKTYTNATSYIFTEPYGLCGNQRYRRELLMMGIIVPEIC